jgi:hypothetical protein
METTSTTTCPKTTLTRKTTNHTTTSVTTNRERAYANTCVRTLHKLLGRSCM